MSFPNQETVDNYSHLIFRFINFVRLTSVFGFVTKNYQKCSLDMFSESALKQGQNESCISSSSAKKKERERDMQSSAQHIDIEAQQMKA